jgi:hypothetical protein
VYPIVVIHDRSQFLYAGRAMDELVDALDAFLQEHRRCGEMDGGVDDGRVWMTCECGAGLCHWLAPPLCYTPPSL